MAKRVRLGSALLVLLLLAGCGGPALTPLPPGATLLAFGDSLTHGTGARGDEAYPAVLAALLDMNVVNAGVPGEVSADGRSRLPALLETHQPHLVILIHGGNDTLRSVPAERTRENLQAMVGQIRGAGAQVVMLGVPGRNLTLSAPDYYGEVAAEAGVPIDASTLPRLMRDSSVKSDPVHFNATGYRRLAEAVLELLREGGAVP